MTKLVHSILFVEGVETRDGRKMIDVILPERSIPLRVSGSIDTPVIGMVTAFTRRDEFIVVDVQLDDEVAEQDWYVAGEISVDWGEGQVVTERGSGAELAIRPRITGVVASNEETSPWPGVSTKLMTPEEVAEEVVKAFTDRMAARDRLEEILMEFVLNVDKAVKADDMEAVKMAVTLVGVAAGNLFEEEGWE